MLKQAPEGFLGAKAQKQDWAEMMCSLPLGHLCAVRETDEETGVRKCSVRCPAGDCGWGRLDALEAQRRTPLVGGKEGFLEEVT